MKEYIKKNGIRLAVILLAIILVVSVGSQVLSGEAGFLTNAIMAVREPINKAATSLGGILEGILRRNGAGARRGRGRRGKPAL